MNFTLKIWRQRDAKSDGRLETYRVTNISPDMSFLEMLDVLNEELIHKGQDPVAFSSDCREGICGSCGLYINGRAHGPLRAVATCQVHLRHFKEGDTIVIEPWRSSAFPVIKDLVVDRSVFDRVMQAGGYISVNTGSAPEANTIPIPKDVVEKALDAASCIACGACVAACKNGSAMLFVSAKVSHLALLPQGQPERHRRVLNMVAAMDREGFGNCTWTGACEVECPARISISNIVRMNREYMAALLTTKEETI
jgi:succinate dehydrogenase / fumarate reductase iron-sulfur subunit